MANEADAVLIYIPANVGQGSEHGISADDEDPRAVLEYRYRDGAVSVVSVRFRGVDALLFPCKPPFSREYLREFLRHAAWKVFADWHYGE